MMGVALLRLAHEHGHFWPISFLQSQGIKQPATLFLF
jgi:hypothetical protein